MFDTIRYTIRPWFQILWGASFLMPLLLKKRSWLGTPIIRTEVPVRFWLITAVGVILIAIGSYEAWARLYVR